MALRAGETDVRNRLHDDGACSCNLRERSPVCDSMNARCLLLIYSVGLGWLAPVLLGAPPAEDLRAALQSGDLAKVQAVVADARAKLGPKAGEPETPDRYEPIPKNGRWLTPAEAQPGFSPQFARLEKLMTWHIGMDPRTMTQPLRAAASVMSGCVAGCMAKLDGADRCEKIARETAEYLMWAQEQGGAGLFPFPLAQGTSEARAMQVATRFIERAAKNGQLEKIARNGWVLDDLGDGGLQFDNAECGVAMFELYGFTRDPRHLASARRAADWASAQPLCTNWNYNSFSVWLLAKAAEVTGEEAYRKAAWQKARLGVIPGQLTDGPHAGRWLDPHNARPAYHYIMLRALAQLGAVLPQGADRSEVLHALELGLSARNAEILTHGLMTKDKAMEALLLVNKLFAQDDAVRRETQSDGALEAVGSLVSEEARHGKTPLSPREWGLFLAAAKARPQG